MNPTPDDPDPASAEDRPPLEVPSSSRGTKPRVGNDTLAEHAAADYLQRGGMRILDRNWRCPEGKIDIVAAEHGCSSYARSRCALLSRKRKLTQ